MSGDSEITSGLETAGPVCGNKETSRQGEKDAEAGNLA